MDLTLQEWLCEFIDQELQHKYVLSYTTFTLNEVNGNLQLIFTDLLRPQVYMINDVAYTNKHLVLDIKISKLNVESKKALFECIKNHLKDSEEYLKYIARID